jgi:serine phosphatase RsbU (regulator of sigma subunit)/pSer/pThr/pTyr-binding forkhead associated (FHA) protein
MAKLITIRGPTRGREYELDELCLLGRSPACQIYIGDLTVSRQHARVTGSSGRWVVEDLGSGNGTYVNETRITQALLQNDDESRISSSVFRFVADQEPGGRWVNMVTVIAGNEPGLVNTVTQARVPVPQAFLESNTSEITIRGDLQRAHRMLETIYAVTEATANVLDPKKLFNQILDYLFNIFPDADRGFIMLLDANNQLIPSAIRRRRGEGFSGGLTVSQSMVGQVLQEGKSVLSTGAVNPKKTFSGATKMCAPLAAGGKTLGILLIEGRPDGKSFTQEDLDLLSGVAMQAGVAILNAHLHQLLLRQQRLEQDMAFAKQIQHSFLPSEPPEVPGFLFSRRYNPVFDVGGDFYDFIPLPEQRIGILIGDVSGKGVSAALLMARLTSDMRYYSISELSPARVLARANAALIAGVQDNMFATVLYMVLDLPRRLLTLSNAGHVPPLLRRGRDASVVEIDEATNLALGVLPDAVFDEYSVELGIGDSLLLCTDGVVEAKSPIQEEYGFARLQRVVGAASPEGLIDAVIKDLQRHSGSTSQYDDITMVAFTRQS